MKENGITYHVFVATDVLGKSAIRFGIKNEDGYIPLGGAEGVTTDDAVKLAERLSSLIDDFQGRWESDDDYGVRISFSNPLPGDVIFFEDATPLYVEDLPMEMRRLFFSALSELYQNSCSIEHA